MDWFARRFLKASLAWLGAGVTLGLAMSLWPRLVIYRPAHLHMNLLGFVAMMIFGVAYHVIPRFTGHPLHSRRMAGAHWWLANAGLAAFVLGFGAQPNVPAAAPLLLALGGSASAASAYLFIYIIWRTIDGPVRAPVEKSRLSDAPVVPIASRRK